MYRLAKRVSNVHNRAWITNSFYFFGGWNLCARTYCSGPFQFYWRSLCLLQFLRQPQTLKLHVWFPSRPTMAGAEVMHILTIREPIRRWNRNHFLWLEWWRHHWSYCHLRRDRIPPGWLPLLQRFDWPAHNKQETGNLAFGLLQSKQKFYSNLCIWLIRRSLHESKTA